MRLIHTADWHLGRLFFGESLIEEQSYVLEELIQLAKDIRPDAVVIAGDVYDRGVPPADAVALLDETLARLVLDCGTHVVMIAGNHDSPERLSFGRRLLAMNRLHVAGRVEAAMPAIRIDDTHGPVHFVVLPYAEPSAVRIALGIEDILDATSAMRLQAADGARAATRAASTAGRERMVAVAHTFLGGGIASESERPLSVGGAAMVEAAVFSEFHYVALGHLHRPQRVGDERCAYSGSLLKYSFDEAAHAKGVLVVELDAAGQAKTEFVPLAPRRDVRMLKGFFEDLMKGPGSEEAGEDFLSVTLLDSSPVIQPMNRLRTVYPKILDLNYLNQEPAGATSALRPDYRTISPMDLFRDFANWSTGEALTAPQDETMAALFFDMEKQRRSE